MTIHRLNEFLTTAGHKPYRKLVEHHVRKLSATQIQAGIDSEFELLPAIVKPYIEPIIDAVNGRVGHDREFWRNATCEEASGVILAVLAQIVPEETWSQALREVQGEIHEDLAWGVFQIVTQNFAGSASLQSKARRFMGVRKGLFG